MISVHRLHYITQDHEDFSHLELAERALESGVRWVQLRLKGADYTNWLRQAKELRELCEKFEARLIINDNVLVARDSEAHGVHLGRKDMDPYEARQILGEGAIIGGTANTIEDVDRLLSSPVDYIGLGPFRDTSTKKELAPILGAEGIKRVVAYLEAQTRRVPVIAIGGLTREDFPLLLPTGISGVAIASAIGCSPSPAETISEIYKDLLEHFGELECQQIRGEQ